MAPELPANDGITWKWGVSLEASLVPYPLHLLCMKVNPVLLFISPSQKFLDSHPILLSHSRLASGVRHFYCPI